MLVTQMRVIPANCQVVLMVLDAKEYPPQWPTGTESVVANSGAIYVATICDVDGEVDIDVWWGELPVQLEHQEPIYDGVLEVQDSGAFVGSYTGSHLGHIELLGEGGHRVQVYTDPPGPQPVRVSFVID